jgi:hypothetical protein
MNPIASLVLGGASIEVGHWSMVVVYDERTGKIVHRHQHVTFKGGAHPDKKALARQALELAPREGGAPAKLASLHVDPTTLKDEAHYKVDVKKRVLVEVKRRAAGTKRR